MEEPVEYVGGLPDAGRPRAWPYLALAAALTVLVAGGLIFRSSILAAGHAFGEAFVPYSLILTAAQWSSDDKLTGIPVTLSLQIQNADPRTVNGLTVHLVKLSPQLQLVTAKPDADINGTTLFFPQSLAPSKAETLSITFLPLRAGDWRFSVTVTPGRGTTSARVQTPEGTVATSLAAAASVRNPNPSDASAQLQASWSPQVAVGSTSTWQIQLTNDGPIAIPTVSLGFPAASSGFEIVAAGPRASVLPDGRLRFVTNLPPGGQATVAMRVVAHAAGLFNVPILVYLGEATEPVPSSAGGPSVTLAIAVS